MLFKKIQKIPFKVIFKILSKIKNQQLWEKIFQLALKKMNFGNGGVFNTSGELQVLNFINNYFKNEHALVIFDVGANIGDYSVAASKIFKLGVSIYTFEPSRTTFPLLLENTKNIQSIISNNIGFSNIEERQKLYTNSEISLLASVYQRNLDHFGIKLDGTEEIYLTTIDAYCIKNKIEQIHLLKLDIEGHELSALKGAKNMIEHGKINFIQFEFGGCNIDARTFFKDFFYLLQGRYRIYRILKNDLHEIQTYNETHEVFLTTNYLAIKR